MGRCLSAPGAAALAAALLTLSAAGCGGGSASTSTSAPPSVPPPATPGVSAVTVTCSPATISANGTARCAASVSGTGAFSPAVTWAASDGTISSAGVFAADGNGDTVTVTAASVQDPSVTGSATITVQPPAAAAVSSIAVHCSPATVPAGGTSSCTAAVAGTGSYSSAVTWAASAGTISAAGLLTAPSAAGSVTVTAASVQDPSVTGSATIAVQPAAAVAPALVLVMEENQSYDTVVGNTADWPALNRLIAAGALPTLFYADTHPSIGNYFMLTTGQILTNDDSSTAVWNVDNLARRMLSAGTSFRIYAEGIPQGYVGGNTGAYLVRHNPFALLSDLADDPAAAQAHIYPFSQFAADLAAGALPAFSYIVPDVNDDAHNGTPLQADAWLEAQVVAPLAASPAFAAGGGGLLIVSFDEAADADVEHGGGHVAPVLWGPLARSGYTQASSTIYQHQSLLRTLSDLLHLGPAPGAAAAAPPMTEFLNPAP